MRITILFVLAAIPTTLFGQTDVKTDSILREGKILYKSEKASWKSSDIFQDRFKHLLNFYGTYFSYTEKDTTKSVFCSNTAVPYVLMTMSFTDQNDTITVDTLAREFTTLEQRLYDIKKRTSEIIKTDNFFRTVPDANLNIVPVIEGNKRRAYILTGPKKPGVVILGNDYLLEFDGSNQLTSKKKLHNNPILLYHDKNDSSSSVSYHTHAIESGELITATDISTLMLYSRYAGWKFHYCISKNKVSIWNCKTQELNIMDRKVWERIHKEIK
ncbi:MAG TPA: hypothetical protein VEA58_11540 [Anaerovoracaceae bacterium]|nr:hypothetical protein [Anaerovoracaceae bacterium]